MYYPEELVEEIRRSNDIVDLISSYIKLQKKGSSYMGLCPFHNEKSPSFSVSRSKQMYHCFGCGVGGNIFTFLMEYENYTFIEALKFLADRAGIQMPELQESPEAKKQADLRNRLLEINKKAAQYFYYQLKSPQGRQAYDYLTGRKLTDHTITGFGLGYSSKYSDDLYKYLKKCGYSDYILKESGLVTVDEKKGIYDKFWNRVMFPIMDVNNRVIGFGGRVMGDGMPKYLNSPETKLFDKSRNLYGLNAARLSRKQYILICEGYMDVIALHQAGFQNSVASLGTAFTQKQASLLKRYADEVLLTYDSDNAGTKAALRAIPILKEAGLSVKVINMKPYKDPDEFIKSMGAEAFEERINQAQNSFFFEIDVLERDYNLEDPEQKTRFFNEVAKKLLVFTEELERNNYIEAVARRYGISYDNLRRLVNRYGAGITPAMAEEMKKKRNTYDKKKSPDDGIRQSQKILLSWLLEDKSLYGKIKDSICADDFMEGLYRDIANAVFEQYEQGDSLIPAKIINRFETKEEQTEAASMFQSKTHEDMSLIEQERALNDVILRIKEYSLEQAGREVSDILQLQKIISEKANLQKLHISLRDG